MDAVSNDLRLVCRGTHREGDVDRTELLTIAESAAAAAANLICNSAMDRRTAHRKGKGKGIVTALDRAVESCIRKEILASRPTDEFLGEELPPLAGHSGVEWIVDPIDGTNNFVAGLPQWSISIAARVYGQIEVAVVHAPATGRTYTALAGAGAHRDGFPLLAEPKTARDLKDAMVATGFASGAGPRARQVSQLSRVLGSVRDVRCHGAASIELCNVAEGGVDAYYESDLRLWDVAAAALIASETGIDISGNPWSGAGTLIAARPHLVGPLRRLVDSSLPP